MDTLKEIMRLQEQLTKIEEEIKNVELLLNVTIKEYGFDDEVATDIQNKYLVAGRPQIGRMLFIALEHLNKIKEITQESIIELQK